MVRAGYRKTVLVPALAVLIALGAALAAAATAHANWLTKILQEAGEAGGKADLRGMGALERSAAHVKALPPAPKGQAALAAHATPEGHWTFVNKAGETFTAGTPDEMKRVAATLVPEAAGPEGKLVLYLSEDSAFTWRQHMKDLPKGAELHVVVGRDGYRLVRRSAGGVERFFAEVRPNIVVELSERKVFDEALWQLARPLDKSRIRLLSLEPGGPQTLTSAPRLDPASKRAAVDVVDPYKLPQALSALRGQTALVIGRVEGEFLHFKPASGPERPILIKDLVGAAEARDVNLIVLEASTPRQPGGRNWLWQKVAVSGLEEALNRASLSDFLNALGASRGQLMVTATPQGGSRVLLSATPTGVSGSPLSGALGDWAAGWAKEVAGNMTGHVVTSTIQAHLRSSERQSELDIRLLPFLPAAVQIAYLAAFVAGLFGVAFAWGWWNRIWPPEQRSEYGNAFGYHSARAVKGVAFVLLFLPIAGPFAFLAVLASQALVIVTAPARLLRWLASRRSAPAG